MILDAALGDRGRLFDALGNEIKNVSWACTETGQVIMTPDNNASSKCVKMPSPLRWEPNCPNCGRQLMIIRRTCAACDAPISDEPD